MIREVDDPAIINGFANHPDIGPSISPGGKPLDLSAGVGPPNVFLFGEHGGICWVWSAPRTYEAHVMLTAAGRGRWGVAVGRESIARMRDKGARLLWARVHPERPEIGIYAALCGMSDTNETHLLDIGEGPVAWRLFEWRA